MSRLGLLQGKSLGFILASLTAGGIAHTAFIMAPSLHNALFGRLDISLLLERRVLFGFRAAFRRFHRL
jgi:hypothetical protein